MNRLAGIRFNLFRLEKKRDDETIDRCLEHVAQLHQVEKEIRNIAHDLNDEAFLPDNNYALLLRELAKENEYDGISVTLNIQDNIIWESVSSVIKMNCYRIIQESLNNIRKHAGATQVCIIFRLESNRLVLEISDNGIGFDLQTVTSGLGLSGIQERIKSMNGRYTLVTEKKKGATTIINIPL